MGVVQELQAESELLKVKASSALLKTAVTIVENYITFGSNETWVYRIWCKNFLSEKRTIKMSARAKFWKTMQCSKEKIEAERTAPRFMFKTHSNLMSLAI